MDDTYPKPVPQERSSALAPGHGSIAAFGPQTPDVVAAVVVHEQQAAAWSQKPFRRGDESRTRHRQLRPGDHHSVRFACRQFGDAGERGGFIARIGEGHGVDPGSDRGQLTLQEAAARVEQDHVSAGYRTQILQRGDELPLDIHDAEEGVLQFRRVERYGQIGHPVSSRGGHGDPPSAPEPAYPFRLGTCRPGTPPRTGTGPGGCSDDQARIRGSCARAAPVSGLAIMRSSSRADSSPFWRIGWWTVVSGGFECGADVQVVEADDAQVRRARAGPPRARPT